MDYGRGSNNRCCFCGHASRGKLDVCVARYIGCYLVYLLVAVTGDFAKVTLFHSRLFCSLFFIRVCMFSVLTSLVCCFTLKCSCFVCRVMQSVLRKRFALLEISDLGSALL